MIKITATDEQMKQMAANAVNASRPVGMGFLHYNPDTEAKPEDFKIEKTCYRHGLFLDYVEGRMVKFSAWKRSENLWEVNEYIGYDYQSWCRKYPTWKVMVESVGAVIEKDVVKE